LNGKPFTEIRDADSDIGARLEVFAAGSYVWIPFEHVASLEMGPPQRLRDTLWAPALVQTAPSFEGMDLGEVLIPAVYPFSWKQPDEQVWLGRVTEFLENEDGGESPVGQKMFLVDGEEFPFLEVRSLTFSHPEITPQQ
jgi:type VI secretion system protein ImpE